MKNCPIILRYVVLGGCLVATSWILAKDTVRTSQTYLFTRPAYQNVGLFLGPWGSLITEKKGTQCCAVQAVPFYQDSRSWPCVSAYFLLNCKPTILIAGDSSANVIERDVRAEWLGIQDETLTSTLTLNPKQRQVGAYLSINKDLACNSSDSFFKNCWVELDVPVLQVKNNIHPSSPSKAVLRSFQRTNLDYAQITGCSVKKAGIAEIKGILGFNFLNGNNLTLSWYLGFAAPGEHTVRPNYLFEPVLGSNGHWSFVSGLISRWPFYECPERGDAARWFFDAELHCYFDNYQYRTLDLVNKPWSRYLLLRHVDPTNPTQGLPGTIPAADIFTQRVKVKPYSIIDLATGFIVEHNNFSFELGYGLWTHHSEQLEWPSKPCCSPMDPIITSYGIADTTAGSLKSASESTIKDMYPDPTGTFVRLNLCDLNLCSGSGQGVAASRLQGAFTFHKCYQDKALLFSLGGAVDFPNVNTALRTWVTWLKIAYEM